MHWILEQVPDRLDIDKQSLSQIKLAEILKAKNIPYSFHKIVPIAGELLPHIPKHIKNAICIGPYSMRNYCKQYNLYPGVYDIEEFDFRIQLQKWGDRMLNANSKVLKFEQLPTLKLSDNKDYFMRPVNDSKVFAGNVFTGKEIMDWYEKVVVLEDDYGDTLTAKTVIQVIEPINIQKEARFWVVNGEIVTHSIYKVGHMVKYKPLDDQNMLNFAKECINIWQPHKAFVIDICTTINNKGQLNYKVVEINTLNAAGFYLADLEKLIDALEKMENLEEISLSR